MDIILDKVNIDKKDTLYRLLEYSLYEESINDLNEINEDGIYPYKWFDSYFLDEDRYAFFIREKDTNKLLGFAMINKHMEIYDDGYSIAEYMVLPKYRNKHIGKKVAYMLFDMFRGNWEVRPSLNSKNAYIFWEKVVSSYTNNNYDFKKGIFVFNNGEV